jgi:LysM repeat protein
MKRLVYQKVVQIASFCLLIALVSGAMAVHAQEEVNLLTNPGFEAPFETHGGDPPREVAQGWTPWHTPATDDMPSYQNAQPIYGQTAPDTPRIRSGDNAQKYYNDLWHTHDGGVYQRVTGITPGTELRFSVYVWVWSSGHEDVDLSEEPGDVTVQVGIDPTGDTDPYSSNILWSIAVSQYDAYRSYSVITTAVSDAVTVYVRSRVELPVANTYIYLDDAVLAETTEPEANTDTPVPPTDTPIPPSDTPVPSATDTSVPQDTNTPVPTATNTEVPVATDTPQEATPTREGDTDTPAPEQTVVSETETAEPDSSSEFPSTITHVVQRGETVGRLAVLYGSTVQAIIDANELNEDALIFVDQELVIPVPLPAPATSTPTPTEAGAVEPTTPEGGIIHTVTAGETLYRIALRYNTTVTAIAQLNGIVNTNLIRVGQELVIPGTGGSTDVTPVPPSPTPEPDEPQEEPTTYVVRPGDNLYRISLRFNVSMLALSEANGIVNVNKIFAGQVLVIP